MTANQGPAHGERADEMAVNNNSHDPLHDVKPAPEPIAIVGMAMRLPGGIHNSTDLWKFLVNKGDARTSIPASRYNIDAFHSASGAPGTIKTKHGYFLAESDGLDHIDASFFSMSKAEVEKLDPQQRMLLEVVYECMENAGQTNWRGDNIGCFVGTFGEDFQDIGAKDTMNSGIYRVAGSGDWALSQRVSYEFDLRGPSVTVQSACSSSMLCVHQAVRAMQAGDCSAAVVAGTSLILTPTMSIAMTEQGVLSPEGSCKTFDAKADGYARGEAINAIYLKPLSAALRDRDPIRALIRGSASNCDGKTPGFSMPSPEAHEAMIRRAYQEAQLDLHDTSYVECHGTGTPIGDPLETTAIANCFGHQSHPVYIGSIKPNLGHSEGASGLSSVIKTVLALENGVIPPNIKFSSPNPKIPWDANLKVPTEPVAWPTDRNRVSVNSFGIGGANAHVILESTKSYGLGLPSTANGVPDSPRPDSAPKKLKSKQSLEDTLLRNGQITPPVESTQSQLLLLSAHSSDALKKSVQSHSEYAMAHPYSLKDLSYTLASHRHHHAQRAFATATRHQPIAFSNLTKANLKNPPHLTFIFTGQGAQWAGMARELILDHPSYRNDIEEMNEVLQSLPKAPSWNIMDELLKPAEESRIKLAEFSQPLCTAIQVAMVNLLDDWGVAPRATIGHSSGEVAAAYAAGALTMKEAIIVAFYRGQGLGASAKKGGMAAIGMGRADVTPYLQDGVVIGCENSPSSVTLSGDLDVLEVIIENIHKARPEMLARKLPVEMAYHSHHMAPYGAPYQATLEKYITAKVPKIPVYSSVYGRAIRTSKLGPEYWRANLENPVLFNTAVASCLQAKTNSQLFVEIGPHSTMAGPLRQIFQGQGRSDVGYVSTMTRFQNCSDSLIRGIGELWVQGIEVNLSQIIDHAKVLVDLPTYQWKHDTSYWFESRVSREWRMRKFPRHEILGSRTLEGNELHPEWRNLLKLEDVPWIRDHKVIDDIVFPFAGYVAMAGEAIRQISGETPFTLRHITVQTALVLTEAKTTEMMTSLRPVALTTSLNSEWWEFDISSFNGTSWMRHANGQVKPGQAAPFQNPQTFSYPRQVANPYPTFKNVGLNYGPDFQGLQEVTTLPGHMTAAATLRVPEKSESVYALHPTTIDHCLQLLLAAHSDGLARRVTKLFMPTGIDELFVGHADTDLVWKAHAKATSVSTGIIGDLTAVAGTEVMLSLQHGKFSPLETEVDSAEPDPVAGARVTYKPDLDFVPTNTLIKPSSDAKLELEKLERFTLLCMVEIKARTFPLGPKLYHLQQFQSWIIWQVARATNGSYELVPDARELASCDDKVRAMMITQMRQEFKPSDATYPAVELINRVVDNCTDIVDGIKSGIEVLQPDNALTYFYNYLEGRTNARRWFELVAHKNPLLRVLEIGAGTGGTTEVVLKGLVDAAGDGQRRMYSSYTYTDVSSGFFPSAKERFVCHPAMSYQVLDISKDPIEQGFESRGYDLIVAANVLHATSKLSETLKNVRKLLAPNGHLFLQELSPQAKAVNLIMGVLPGWWLGAEDGRDNEPYVGTDRWDKELKAAGFNGVDVSILDDAEGFHLNANILAQPAETDEVQTAVNKRVTLLVDAVETSFNRSVVDATHEALSEQGLAVDICTLAQTLPKNQDIISLLEIDNPLIWDLGSDKFASIQKLIADNNSSGLLWVTRSNSDPRFGAVLGLARTLRHELNMSFATLQIEDFSSNTCQAIADVFSKFHQRNEDADVDPEYEWTVDSTGTIMIGRWQTVDIKEEVEDEADVGELKLELGKVGLVQTLLWAPYQVSAIGADDVVIDCKTAGINYRDILITQGTIAGGLGFEGAGLVRSIGSNVKHVAPGDRVMMLGSDCFSTRAVLPAVQVVKIPDTMTLEEAATIPFAFATAVQSIIKIGQFEDNQSILVHNASSAVGIAAIQICRNYFNGVKIYATASNEDRANFVSASFNLPREHIFDSNDTSFMYHLKAATKGEGVDLVLNNLTGELLHASWECVAEDGKMIELGKKDLVGKGHLRLDLMEANRTFVGVDISKLKGSKLKSLLETTMSLLNSRRIKPISPMKVFDSDDVEDAFRYAQNGEINEDHIGGKLVVRLPDSGKDSDGLLSAAPKQLALDADKSYLLVGGLGGLGRSLATYLIENGARHLIIFSRSAGKSDADKVFVAELEAQHCEVQLVQGDVSNLKDVQRCRDTAKKPIAGVLQLSMVLRDGSFLNMKQADWAAAIAPKLQGTFNLHDALGDTLDFFVATSSISGAFGNAGQANYAAANSFLDSFCQWRHRHGLPASVLDVGVVGDVGYVASNTTIQDNLKQAGYYVLREQDVLDALKWAIISGTPGNQHQLAIGVRSTKNLDDVSCRVNWRRDRRMAAYRNNADDGEASSLSASSPTADALVSIVPKLKGNPGLLDAPGVEDSIKEEIGRKIYTLMLQPTDEMDLSVSLAQLGVDSLVTIEVRNWIKRATSGVSSAGGVEISTLELMGVGSVGAVGDLVISGLKDRLQAA